MTDKQMLAKLEKAEKLLKQTTRGYNPTGQYWKPAMALLDECEAALRVQPPKPTPPLVFPITGLDTKVATGGLHETGGLPGNWAIDFICKAGSGICSPERATVTRFSGHDPATGKPNAVGVYGWTTYLQTPAGYVYFLTHQGRRLPSLKVGQRVEPGDLLGFVGHQQPLTGRPDHLHIGVSSPHGPADAKKRITAVSKAPRAS